MTLLGCNAGLMLEFQPAIRHEKIDFTTNTSTAGGVQGRGAFYAERAVDTRHGKICIYFCTYIYVHINMYFCKIYLHIF